MAVSRPFVVDTALTAIAIGFRNPAAILIADRVLPRVSVGGERFKWLEYPLAEAFTLPPTFVGRKGRPNQVEFTSIERTAAVDDFALDDMIPSTDMTAAAQLREAGLSTYDPERRAVEGLTDLIINDREVRVANLVTNLNTFAPALRVTLSGTAQWSDYANSNPITAILAALDLPMMRPNKLVMGQALWTVVRQHPKVVNAILGGNLNSGAVTTEQFARLMEVEEVLVGQGWINVARKGQAANMQRIWGKDCAMLYINPIAGPENMVTFGYTAEYGARVAGTIIDPNIGIMGGEAKRVGERVKEVIAAQAVGYLFKSAAA
jgi:Phage major capsid protein E